VDECEHQCDAFDQHIGGLYDEIDRLKEGKRYWDGRWENVVMCLRDHPDYDETEPTVEELRASERRAMGITE